VDEIVLRAIAKWPNVPAVYGWLRLDRRGNWLIKDDRVSNPAIVAYIGRNFARDGSGRWFFQNGPQRVFAVLDYTPFVYRITGAAGGPVGIEAHTGRTINTTGNAWIDENGALLLATDLGIGVVHDRDLDRLLPLFVDANGTALPEDVLDERMELTQQGRSVPLWLKLGGTMLKVEPLRASEVPVRFAFVPSPVQPAGDEPCS
jgi:hypothetical protein